MKHKILIILLLLTGVMQSQTLIKGTIFTKDTISVDRNFIGFNTSPGASESIYSRNNKSSGLEVNKYFYQVFSEFPKNTYYRFPCGEGGKYYRRYYAGFGNRGTNSLAGNDVSYMFPRVDTLRVIANYSIYNNFYTKGYNTAKYNVIFPFINSITKDITKIAKSSYVIPIANHYRSGAIKNETIQDTNKIKAIKSLDDFSKSTLSKAWKEIVYENINTFLTLNNNNVIVDKIEIGNELYSYQFDCNIFTNFNTFKSTDTKIWIRDCGSKQSIKDAQSSLWAFAHLAKMYRVLINDTIQKLSKDNDIYLDLSKTINYGIPLSPILKGGFARYNDFFISKVVKDYIGFQAYCIHPYADSMQVFKFKLTDKTNSDTNVLKAEFNRVRDTLENTYYNKTFKGIYINLLNTLPENSKIWYTEWNMMFDWVNLQKFGNTFLHASYYTNMMMNFFDVNSNTNLNVSSKLKNPIQLCNYQIQYAIDDTWYAMVRINSEGVKYNSAYYAQLLLNPVLTDTSYKYIKATNGGFAIIKNCSFRTFIKSNNSAYIYFNNTSGQDYYISLSSSFNKTILYGQKDYLIANNLYDAFGKTSFKSEDIYKKDDVRLISEIIKEDNVLIPRYSLGYIKVNIK